MNFIQYFFIPHHKNNFRSKLLHHSSLIVISVLFLFLTLSYSAIQKGKPSVLGISYAISSDELVALTNKVRIEHNLKPLKVNQRLISAARFKAAYMFEHNYWAHFAPDGTSPWYFIKNAGYEYEYAGENLAKGFTNSSDIVTAWMNSPTHRDNVLSPKYNDIGFAVVEGKLLGEDTVLVVQMFGSISPSAVEKEIPNPENLDNNPQHIVSDNVLAKQTQGNFNALYKTPFIDVKMTSKGIILIVMITLISVLLLDLYVVESKKIPRVIGHNIDHIILITLFVLFMLIEKSGGIL